MFSLKIKILLSIPEHVTHAGKGSSYMGKFYYKVFFTTSIHIIIDEITPIRNTGTGGVF